MNASAYRPLSAFKTQEINDILKTSRRYAAATTSRNPNTLISFVQIMHCSQPVINIHDAVVISRGT